MNVVVVKDHGTYKIWKKHMWVCMGGFWVSDAGAVASWSSVASVVCSLVPQLMLSLVVGSCGSGVGSGSGSGFGRGSGIGSGSGSGVGFGNGNGI